MIGNWQDIIRAFKQCLEAPKRKNNNSGNEKCGYYFKKKLAIKGKH